MKRNARHESVQCQHYCWKLYPRGRQWYADGRGNSPPLGRHSLGVGDPQEARKKLVGLDRKMAIRNGLIPPGTEQPASLQSLSLDDGRKYFEQHLARPEVAGGPCEKTRKRYKAVLDKLVPFLKERGISSWNGITEGILCDYIAWLKSDGYAERTLATEATVTKQSLKFLAKRGHIPSGCLFELPIRKPLESDAYCWTLEQYQAMLDYCAGRRELYWLLHLIVAFARTGMRHEEVITLRWPDVDLENGVIRLTNDPASSKGESRERRRTKNRQDRTIPIHSELRQILEKLPQTASGLVFRGPCGGKLKQDKVRTALRRHIIEPLKSRFPRVPGQKGFEDGTPHSFRHFFCSVAANSGVPERVVTKWLGHCDKSMLRRYYHLHDDESQQFMLRLKPTANLEGRVAPDSAA